MVGGLLYEFTSGAHLSHEKGGSLDPPQLSMSCDKTEDSAAYLRLLPPYDNCFCVFSFERFNHLPQLKQIEFIQRACRRRRLYRGVTHH